PTWRWPTTPSRTSGTRRRWHRCSTAIPSGSTGHGQTNPTESARRGQLLSQLALEHLAGGVARKLVVAEEDPGRDLEGGQPLGYVPAQRVFVDGGAVAQPDDGTHLFPQLGVREADHGDVADVGVLEQGALDLGGVDVLAPADDDVLDAVDHVEPAALVEATEVAGVEPAVAERLGRC